MVECTNKQTGKVYFHTEAEAEQIKHHPQTKGKFSFKLVKGKEEPKPAVAKKTSPKEK